MTKLAAKAAPSTDGASSVAAADATASAAATDAAASFVFTTVFLTGVIRGLKTIDTYGVGIVYQEPSLY
jgi:hypothetical protein